MAGLKCAQFTCDLNACVAAGDAELKLALQMEKNKIETAAPTLMVVEKY